MPSLSKPQDPPQPENLLRHLVAQLSRHALCDALLVFVPPALALIYMAVYLNRAAWLNSSALILLVAVIAGITALAVFLRYRPLIPTIAVAARLADQRSRAMDRFLTLATIDRGTFSASLVARLRAETAGFGEKIALERDFPYRFKNSFYWSLGVSLAAGLLIHLLLPVAQATFYPPPAHQRLRELAEKIAASPGLVETARRLKALAEKVADPKTSEDEERKLIEELRERIAEEQKKQLPAQEKELLSEAAGTLKSLEKQAAGGQEKQKNSAQGGGDIKSNLPQNGQGEGALKQSGERDGKGEPSAERSKEGNSDGKLAKSDSREKGEEKSGAKETEGKDERKGDQTDPNKSGEAKTAPGKDGKDSPEKGGKTKSPEDIPEGMMSMKDRFYQPGEEGKGKAGLKSPRYVTVQLPEIIAEDRAGKRQGARSKEGKGGRARSEVPVSNVPLPSHVPGAPSERQQMPIEYRGVIR
jgi:hypothetical protein